ncbi:unnamed protein product [Acanthosepion pharaonis]|uniref:Uncharacterized protein n=1 Tax=Acanthosepion pharaonis TaxID=158019 RepID=A0A812CJ42_ACAPH|nr:unnamed protein product [Sepia pharaonis]
MIYHWRKTVDMSTQRQPSPTQYRICKSFICRLRSFFPIFLLSINFFIFGLFLCLHPLFFHFRFTLFVFFLLLFGLGSPYFNSFHLAFLIFYSSFPFLLIYSFFWLFLSLIQYFLFPFFPLNSLFLLYNFLPSLLLLSQFSLFLTQFIITIASSQNNSCLLQYLETKDTYTSIYLSIYLSITVQYLSTPAFSISVYP